MATEDVKIAQVQFQNRIEELLESRKELYKTRDKFVEKFTPQFIENMPIELYTIGGKESDNFCYILERKLQELGDIRGSNAFKFGVYYGKTKSEPEIKYRFAKKFGSNYQEAFENVRKGILTLLQAGKKKDLNEIVRNKLSPMFKGKILSTYYYERYLNIYSDKHLEHYLVHLNIDSDELIEADPVFKREALVKFKEQDEVMKDWSLDVLPLFYIVPIRAVLPTMINMATKILLKVIENQNFLRIQNLSLST